MFISSETFWNILEINAEILTVISLVVVLKKDYYLIIDVKDVIKKYNIPNDVMEVVVASSILFFYGEYTV